MIHTSDTAQYRKEFASRFANVIPSLATELDLRHEQVKKLVDRAVASIVTGYAPDESPAPVDNPVAFAKGYRGSMFFITPDVQAQGRQCAQYRAEMGLAVDELAFIAGLSPILVILFEEGVFRPSAAALLEIQMALCVGEALIDSGKATLDDVESFKSKLQDIYSGKAPGFSGRSRDQWTKNKAYIDATGEGWPESPDKALAFLG